MGNEVESEQGEEDDEKFRISRHHKINGNFPRKLIKKNQNGRIERLSFKDVPFDHN